MNDNSPAIAIAEWLEHHGEKTSHALAADELRRLHGERATLAGWIAEALSVLETDAEGDDAKRLLIERGNALVVAVRGGDVPATDFGNNGPAA